MSRWLGGSVLRAVSVLASAASLLISVGVRAQTTSTITALTVVKKPGQTDGQAMATVKTTVRVKGKTTETQKTGRIASHALQAWTIMGGQGALLLLSPQKKDEQYRVRYYELDAGKGRYLGHVPFAEATMAESSEPNSPWAFAVAGSDPSTKHPMIFAGDVEAIHARIEEGSEPHFSGESLAFQEHGNPQSLTIAVLMGQEVAGRIYAPVNATAQTAYVQFLPNGDSITTSSSGEVERGRWITNGAEFHVTSPKGTETVWRLAELEPVTGVPATSRLTVRLLEPLSSRTAKEGTVVKAVLISPGVFDSAILLPQGSEFDGKVTAAHGVGLAVKHETAALTVHFEQVKLPNGRILQVDARIFKIENSREEVTKSGKIQGIRSTGTIGHSAENQIASLAQIDPIAYIFTGTAGPAVLGFSEPEILYNAGTELDIEFNKPVITAEKYDPRVPRLTLSPEQAAEFNTMVKNLPFRTRTEQAHIPSDITNLIFIGKPDSLRRAFEAAGWTTSDQLTAAATFQTVKTLTGNQTYTQAPMSMLLLGDDQPIITLQKTTNTFSSRHHLRVFQTGQTFEGEPVLTASSTQDIGIAFSYKQKTFIHVIDPYLDNERSKVTNDLEFTDCVDSIDLVPRPWVPQDAYNSTGDRLRTDGAAAVLKINDCANPHATPATVAPRAPLLERSERNTLLTIKDTLYRGNLIYTGISGGMKIHSYLATQGELAEDTGNWRKSDASGNQYRLAGTAPHLLRRKGPAGSTPNGELFDQDADAKARIAAHRWDPPHFEIALNLGYSRYRTSDLEFTQVFLESSEDEPTYGISLYDSVGDGWAASISLTLNSGKWLSNEFAYSRQQTKFSLGEISASSDPNEPASLDSRLVGLTTRQAEYNTLFNLRRRESRWRPYVAVGPVLQLISLSNAPLKKPAGYFRLGLSNIGLIKAAFDFGNTPPLNGGGIFQFGLQYGGGIKYRVQPRITLRADFRETWAKNPSIIRDSYVGYEPEGLDDTYTTDVMNFKPLAKYFQQRATMGVAFTF
jgi:LssY C-terminus